LQISHNNWSFCLGRCNTFHDKYMYVLYIYIPLCIYICIHIMLKLLFLCPIP
jgi:hypothetical protein